jgi:uncharacterized protein YgiM (DUF1202 family)
MATITTASALKNIGVLGKRIVATKTDPLNLRQAPTTSSLSLLRIPKGASVDVLNCTTTSGWTAVRYNGTEGFVSSQYLANPPTTTDTSQSDVTSTTVITKPTNSNNTMGEKVKKYGKYVLIAAGVGIVAFAGYKLLNKSSGGRRRRGKSLNGVSRKPLMLK